MDDVVRNAKALLAEEDERVGQLLKARGLDAVKAIMGGHQYMSPKAEGESRKAKVKNKGAP